MNHTELNDNHSVRTYTVLATFGVHGVTWQAVGKLILYQITGNSVPLPLSYVKNYLDCAQKHRTRSIHSCGIRGAY